MPEMRTYNIDFMDVTGDEPTVVQIDPGFVHNITATGHETMYLVIWCNEQFSSDDPDTKSERVEIDKGFDSSRLQTRTDTAFQDYPKA